MTNEIIEEIEEPKELKINNTILLTFIKGLKYNEDTQDYTFKRKKYKLRDIKEKSSKSQFYYFVNINDPLDMKVVKYSGGIPLHDGFNDVDIDSKLRRLEWKRQYYKDVVLDRRHKASEIKKEQKAKQKAKLEAKKQKAKELAKKKALEKIKPIKCAFCGKEFKPTQTQQRFCCDSCRIKYFSKQQGEARKLSIKTTKICPICKKAFLGNPRDVYCSKECYSTAQNNARKTNKKVIVVKKNEKK